MTKVTGSSLNMSQNRPPNQMNKIITCLMGFTLFPVAYSADIAHCYRNFQLHPSQQQYQLMWYFDLSKTSWENYPKLIKQKTLIYRGTQSEILVEVCIRKYIANKMEPGVARLILEFYRLVDNMTYSFRITQDMIKEAKIIREELAKYNLPLKCCFETNDPATPSEAANTIIYGYTWNKQKDTLSPHIEHSI